MAGLIQKQMADEGGEAMPSGPAPAPAVPDSAQAQAQAEAAMPETEEGGEQPDESSPAFQQAMTYAYKALYESQAAKDVAQQLKAAQSLADGMAEVAYNITSIVDERTDGQVPDELLVPLAMQVLEEVGEVAQAAGLEPQPEDVAAAFKTMILRYLGEQGVDTTQLQQAMDQVDPAQFRQMAEQA
jgi:hypothetical protein